MMKARTASRKAECSMPATLHTGKMVFLCNSHLGVVERDQFVTVRPKPTVTEPHGSNGANSEIARKMRNCGAI
jgi:hypothetical protein